MEEDNIQAEISVKNRTGKYVTKKPLEKNFTFP